MYPYPLWRRAPFIALIIVILVITYAPATTQGTATLRLVALSAPSTVTHIYVAVSTIELHRQGFLNSTGWTTVSQSFPAIDLLSAANQSVAQTISSATIHSGRYDAVRILFTNSTLVISGVRKSAAAPSPLHFNSTFLVPPNGIGDMLLVVAFDYTAIFAASPSLSFILIRESLS